MKNKNKNKNYIVSTPCTLSGTLRFTRKKEKNPSMIKSRNNNKCKLIRDSNTLTALSGAFSAYKTMNEEQFKLIVEAFKPTT